jgi:hemolysin activation/secretion protein
MRDCGRACRAIVATSFAALAAISGACPAAPADPAPDSSQAAASEPFDILEIRVLGNSVLPVVEVERAVIGYTGPRRSVNDVQAARAALENSYHAAGFATVFVDVPEQDVTEGIVRLRVLEGRVEHVRVVGARYVSGRKILAALPELQRDTVPKLPELQRELTAVNQQSADRSVTPVMKAGRTPGTLDVDLRVKDTLPLHASATVNNGYTINTSHLRSVLDVSYGNLFQEGQSFSFEYQTAPQHTADARVLAFDYVAPLTALHSMLALYAVDTNSDVATVGALSVLGKGHIFGTRLIHPFGAGSANISFGADLKDFHETVNLSDGTADKTPIRYVNWALQYSYTEHAAGHDLLLTVGPSFGALAAPNRGADFDYKRFGANANYAYLRGSGEYRLGLPFSSSIRLRLSGQLAEAPLVSNEQFGAGGSATVRGYLESQVLGDNGVAGSLELYSPSWALLRGTENLAFLAFLDEGYVAIIEPLPQQQARFQLASMGLGARLTGHTGLTGSLDWAYPLRRNGTVQRGESRVLFNFSYGF